MANRQKKYFIYYLTKYRFKIFEIKIKIFSLKTLNFEISSNRNIT